MAFERKAKKRTPVRSLPREAPLEWDGFSDAFWRQNIADAKFFVRPRPPPDTPSPEADSRGEESGAADDESDRGAASRGPSASAPKQEEALTDLQKLIVQAIVSHGGSASTDEIERYVSQFWVKLKKRDGSSYAYDCRRVVLASLSNASNIRPLFLRDSDAGVAVSNDEQRWKLGPRGDDLGIKPDELPFLDVSLKLGPTSAAASAAAAAAAARARPAGNRAKRARAASPSGDTAAAAASTTDAAASTATTAAAAASAATTTAGAAAALTTAASAASAAPLTLATLTPEQHAVAVYLAECSDFTAHIGDLIAVLQRAGFVNGSRSDARRQTELVLEADGFSARTVGDKWKLAAHLAAEIDDAHADDASAPTTAAAGGSSTLVAAGDGDEWSTMLPSVKRSRSDGGGGGGEADDAPPGVSALSAIFGEGDISMMQETLMGIVLEHNGSAHIDTITELAAQRIPSMRKKNMDVRRSIVASLSHNPPGFFRKHTARPGYWTITPRGRLLADAMISTSQDRALYSLTDAASDS